MAPCLFGSYKGTDVHEVTLRTKAGAEASVLTWGAVVRDLKVPARGGPQRVVLGFEEFDAYPAHSPYFGATVGRFANRIAGGRFELDGKTYQLDCNEGANALHGGSEGYGQRVWSLAELTDNSVTLVLISGDGDMGYPGRVVATCTYTLQEPGTLRVELSATTDAPTPLSLAHHSYFNLDGSPNILDHELAVASDFYTPVDAELIPTGEILAVAGTPFDFRKPRPIRFDTGKGHANYDHNFVLRHKSLFGHAATMYSPKSGVVLNVYTSEPGLQVYDSGMLDVPVPGLGGAHYGRYGGLCMEAQRFPDAPNRSHFLSSILRPGEVYTQLTDYAFS